MSHSIIQTKDYPKSDKINGPVYLMAKTSQLEIIPLWIYKYCIKFILVFYKTTPGIEKHRLISVTAIELSSKNCSSAFVLILSTKVSLCLMKQTENISIVGLERQGQWAQIYKTAKQTFFFF